MTAQLPGELPASEQRTVDTPQPQTNGTSPQLRNNLETIAASTDSDSTARREYPNHAFNAFPDELWNHVLQYLLHDPAKLLPFDQRASLSFESFASAPPHISEDAGNLLKFRLLCKKTLDLGRSRVFSRVKIRFSKAGFNKILSIIDDPEIASEVRKVSYMVHDLYPQDRGRLERILQDVQASISTCERRLDDMQVSQTASSIQFTPAIRRLNAELERCRRNERLIGEVIVRAEEQRQIIQEGQDERVLVRILTAFKNVQQIRLMRNVDKLDGRWENFLNTSQALRNEFGRSRWTSSCERATMVIGRAYLASKSTAHRLSSRFLDPSPEWLQDHISEAAISSLSTRLICLELQIDHPYDLNDKMSKLSDVFRTVFNAAAKMEGLHIGLRRQISIPLENIFHNVTWPRLLYMGFSRWNLSSDEIINFLYRHRASLRQVRFREVRLTKGKWVEILEFLRQQLKLKWASFRQVGYEPRIGGGLAPAAEFGTGRPGFALLRRPDDDGEDSTSTESSDDDSAIGHHAGTGNGPAEDNTGEDMDGSEANESNSNTDNESEETVDEVHRNIHGTAHFEDQEADPSNSIEYAGSVSEEGQSNNPGESPSGSVAGDSEVGVVNGLALDDQMMVEHSSAPVDPHPDDPLPDCDCQIGYAWDDLEDDNGLDPTKPQWKKWEKWVVRPCSGHDPPAN